MAEVFSVPPHPSRYNRSTLSPKRARAIHQLCFVCFPSAQAAVIILAYFFLICRGHMMIDGFLHLDGEPPGKVAPIPRGTRSACLLYLRRAGICGTTVTAFSPCADLKVGATT